MLPTPLLLAEATPDLLTTLSRGGTGALIVALCIAVVALYRRHEANDAAHRTRVEALQAALVDAHKKHGEDLTKMVDASHEKFAEIADRYNGLLASVNDARVAEMRVITDAASALRGDSGAVDRPQPVPRKRTP